ncbi:ankyrin repeat domain-containing protein [Chitinibacter sp. S2-10]|uniref:ankyrin repeat domain-containing protein n=1 Tax=Chitinibacter sp. S2-10 TaxID=3373597 RepID=UPI003977716C
MNFTLTALLGTEHHLYPRQLEQSHPRVLRQIATLWGSDQLETFISALLVDDRGNRQGFAPEIVSELFALYRLHNSRFGTKNSHHPWDHVKEPCKGLKHDELEQNNKAYFQAIECGNTLKVLALLKSGINIESADEFGKTALIWAATCSHLPMLGLLLSRNANTETCDLGGFTALHWAAAEGHLAAIQLLREHAARLDAKSKTGVTPLMQAASRGQHAALRLLLESGASIAQTDASGQCALGYALQASHNHCCEELLLQHSKRAQGISSKVGWQAFQLGLSHHNRTIRQLFSKHRFELSSSI